MDFEDCPCCQDPICFACCQERFQPDTKVRPTYPASLYLEAPDFEAGVDPPNPFPLELAKVFGATASDPCSAGWYGGASSANNCEGPVQVTVPETGECFAYGFAVSCLHTIDTNHFPVPYDPFLPAWSLIINIFLACGDCEGGGSAAAYEAATQHECGEEAPLELEWPSTTLGRILVYEEAPP